MSNYEKIHLEIGMYGVSGKSFTQLLEELDPSDAYQGTALEGLDAYQRQLKRFDIRVGGADSSRVESSSRQPTARRFSPNMSAVRCVRGWSRRMFCPQSSLQ
ncbi:MAG: hypothetical protein ACLSB9_08690 [Hydrogeniiclostridium mannosilyticum]